MENLREIKTLADTAAGQIAEYPVITGKDRLKRLVRERVLRQKLAPIDPFSWPNAMLGEGLLAVFEAVGEESCLMAVVSHLKRWKSAGYPIHYVDNIINGSLALWIEELISVKPAGTEAMNSRALTGIREKRRLQLSEGEIQEILRLCRETEKVCADWVRRAARTQAGILPYRQHHPDWLFADTLGMVCPFLCRYGMRTGDEELTALGIAQLKHFLENGMDERTGLCYHGYDGKTGMKYGIIGWGRACGWMLKGLAESLPWLSKERKEYPELLAGYTKLADAAFAFQRPDGGFSWQLEALEGHRDSSAEGMIGAAVLKGMSAGILQTAAGQAVRKDPDVYGERIGQLKGILEHSASGGMVSDCSGECNGFAEYPQNYGCYPWGTGSALEFLALSKKAAFCEKG